MTALQLDALCAEFELHAPVTMSDLGDLYAEIKSKLPLGILLDIVAREGAVTVAIGQQAARYEVRIPIIA